MSDSGDARSGIIKRLFVGCLTLVLAVSSLIWSSAAPVDAASEIDWYVAVPGYVRTDFLASKVIANPVDDGLYALVDDAGTWSLHRIDPADFSITADVGIGADRVIDLVASEDGAWLFVLTRNEVRRYDASTLVLAESTAVVLDSTAAELDVAPDRTDRFAVVGWGSVEIYTAGVELDVAETVLENVDAFGFTADSDIVMVNGFGPPKTVDISSGVATVATGDQLVEGEGVIDRFGDGALLWSYGAVTRLDAAMRLVSVTTIDAFWDGSRPVRRLDEEAVYTTGPSATHRFDLFGSAPPTSWSLPIPDYTPDIQAALSNGLIVALEDRVREEPGYLIVMNSNVLTSGFGDYHSLTPERVLDTRHAIGIPTTRRIRAGETITVDLAGRAGLPDSGILAVTMNATATEPLGAGFLKIWPSGVARPEISNVNYVAGRTIANSVTALVGVDGTVQVYNHAETATHVLLDVTGYYSDSSGDLGSRYVPLDSPVRLMDTRSPTYGHPSKLGPGEFIDIAVPLVHDAARLGRRAEADAAVLNVTVVDATAFSFVTAYPSAPTRPETSTLNFYPGDIRSNLAITPISQAGTVRIYNHVGEVNIVVDLFGHYADPVPLFRDDFVDQWGRMYPVSPFRDFDSREQSPFGGTGALEPASVLILPNSIGWTDILNVTVTEPTSDGYVSVVGWNGRPVQFPPAVSNVNFTRGETVPNAAYATGIPDSGIINVIGYTHLVIDVFGYLTPSELTRIESVWSQQLQGGLAASLVGD